MGCYCSKNNAHLVRDHDEQIHVDAGILLNCIVAENEEEEENEGCDLPTFKVYTIEQVRRATLNFATENKVVEWHKPAGTLYNGTLEEDQRQVSVARLYYYNRRDTQQFLTDARVVGRLRGQRLMNLLGCCNEGEERILIAESMPNGTLAKHLFDRETPPMKWAMRLRVALIVAQAIEYCTSKGILIHYLNHHNIFFDEDGNPRLSSFGLMQSIDLGQTIYATDMVYRAQECVMRGRWVPASVVYSFGCLLLVLLSGREITQTEVLEVIREGKVHTLTDPRLDGQLSSRDVTKVASLATLCLQTDTKARPKPETLISFLSPLQKENKVPSSVLMGLDRCLSPLGEACKRKDLTAIHEILENLGYKDDEGATTEVQDTKENGDVAFRNKDFNVAINSYTKFIDAATMVSPTIHARRSLSYLMSDSREEARSDAIKAQEIFPTWHVASYLEAAALFALGKDNEAKTALRKGSLLQRKNAKNS